MFSLSFFAVIFFLILQIYARTFRFADFQRPVGPQEDFLSARTFRPADFQRNEDFQRPARPQREDIFSARTFRPADFQRNVDFNFISSAKRLYPGPKTNLDTIYKQAFNPAKRLYPGTEPNFDTFQKPALKCNDTQECVRHYVVMPQNCQGSGSIFSNVPSVAIYTNTFLEAIYSTDLREVFDLCQTTAKQFVDFFTPYGTNYVLSFCIENAEELAEFGFRGILPNFDVLTLPVVARFFANSAANFLFTDGFLCMDNAVDLALSHAQSMADSAKVNLNSDPTSKFQVLADGYVNYFGSLGVATKEKIPFLAFYVGNEWFVAAHNYKYC